jgi:glycosyltransferase involved in cell wall biosynthesis
MKTKLLFVNGHLKIGGVEKALVDLLSSIDYSRYDVDLLLLEGEGDYISLLPPQVRVLHKDTRQLDGPFLSVLLRNLAKLRIGNCLYRIIQSLSKSFGRRYLRLLSCLLPCKKKYDVAIAFRPGHSAEIAAYAIKADKKFIWWHHGVVPDKAYQIHKLGELFRVFDKVVTVSDGCRGMLKDCFHLPDDKLAVIPNIVDDRKLEFMSEDDDPFGDDHRFRIVTVSRFSPEKHLVDAVDAAAMLVGKLDFVWYFIGDGNEYAMLAQRVRDMDLSNYVVLPGQSANPYPYVRYSDLMVHPSPVESLCLSVLEAMSLRIPCVVVRSLGPESYMASGDKGILTSSGPDSISQGILDFVGMDMTEKKAMIANAADMVKNRFSPDVVINSFEALINGD